MVDNDDNAGLCNQTLELEKMLEAFSKRFDQNEYEFNALKVEVKTVNEQNKVLKQNVKEIQNQNNILKQDLETMKVKLDSNNSELNQLREQLRKKSLEVSSQESAMEVGESPQDKSNDNQDLQVLQQLKQSGYSRVSPVASPVKNKEKFVCDTCGYMYEDKERLKHHIEQIHLTAVKTVVKSPEMRIETVVSDRPQKPTVSQNVSGRRNYNCHNCDFQGNSSKNLYKHLKENLHQGDPVSERCFTCNEMCKNFDDLMSHRKYKHADKINSCRYFSQNQCKYESNCWYSHEPKKSFSQIQQTNYHSSQTDSSQPNVQNNSQNDSNFHLAQSQIPPDQIGQIFSSVSVQLESLQNILKGLTIFSSKGDYQKRQRGV